MIKPDKKFLAKNSENINMLNSYIDSNRDNIDSIIISFELFEHLKLLKNCSRFDDNSNTLIYHDIRVFMNPWTLTKRIKFVMKSNFIDFNLPCVCGIYPDEKHP